MKVLKSFYQDLSLSTVMVLAPFFIGMLLTLHHFAVNIPFGDEWTMARVMHHIHDGNFSFGDLWNLHNEHRIFFPKLSMLVVALLSGWNIKLQIFCNLVIATITAYMIISYFSRNVKDRTLRVVGSSVIALYFFSPVQWENWLWAWQLTWFLSMLFIVATIFSVSRLDERASWRRLAVAIGLAIAATFSLGNGLVVWPVGFILLIVNKVRRSTYIAWLTAAIVSVVVYYHGYQKPASSPPTNFFLNHPLDSVRYYLAVLGRPITDNLDAATIFGGMLLAVSAGLLLYSLFAKRKRGDATGFSGLVMFVYGAVALTTISRVGFGLGQGLSSRYTADGLLLMAAAIGLFLVAADTLREKPVRYLLAAMVLLSSLPLLFASYTNGFKGLKDRSTYMRSVAKCTHAVRLTEACAEYTFPGNGSTVREEMPYVRASHKGSF